MQIHTNNNGIFLPKLFWPTMRKNSRSEQLVDETIDPATQRFIMKVVGFLKIVEFQLLLHLKVWFDYRNFRNRTVRWTPPGSKLEGICRDRFGFFLSTGLLLILMDIIHHLLEILWIFPIQNNNSISICDFVIYAAYKRI